jgi:hypothetical protein
VPPIFFAQQLTSTNSRYARHEKGQITLVSLSRYHRYTAVPGFEHVDGGFMWRARTGKPAADAALGVDPVSLRTGALASRNSPSHRPRDPSVHSAEAGSGLFERVLMVNFSL